MLTSHLISRIVRPLVIYLSGHIFGAIFRYSNVQSHGELACQ